MFRKIIAAALSAAVALTAVSAVYSAETSSDYSEDAEIDMYEFISESSCIVLAVYEGRADGEYKFKVIRTLKNEMPESIFYLTASDNLGGELERGGRYVLFLDSDTSVYYAHDKYTAIDNLLISADEKNLITGMTEDGLAVKNHPESVSALKRYIDDIPDTSPKKRGYVRSESESDIIKQSDIIVRAEITERISDAGKGCGKYKCRAVSVLKGKINEDFSVVLFDGRIKTGGEYFLLLNRENGAYVLSSKKSIYSVSNSAFKEILNGENTVKNS